MWELGGRRCPPCPPPLLGSLAANVAGRALYVLASRPLAYSASLFAYRAVFGCRGYSASSLVPSPIGGVRVLSGCPCRAPAPRCRGAPSRTRLRALSLRSAERLGHYLSATARCCEPAGRGFPPGAVAPGLPPCLRSRMSDGFRHYLSATAI